MLFSARGFDGVRTREIAKEANVAEKTLFQHFGSKAELFTQVLQQRVMKLSGPAALAEVVQVLTRPDATLRDKLRVLALDRISFLRKHPNLASFILRELLQREAFRDAFFSQLGKRTANAFQSLFSLATTRGEIGPVDPARAFRLFVTTLIGYSVTRTVFFPSHAWDDEAEVDAMLETLFHGWTTA